MPIYPDTNDQRRIYNSDAKTLLQNWVEEVYIINDYLIFFGFTVVKLIFKIKFREK